MPTSSSPSPSSTTSRSAGTCRSIGSPATSPARARRSSSSSSQRRTRWSASCWRRARTCSRTTRSMGSGPPSRAASSIEAETPHRGRHAGPVPDGRTVLMPSEGAPEPVRSAWWRIPLYPAAIPIALILQAWAAAAVHPAAMYRSLVVAVLFSLVLTLVVAAVSRSRDLGGLGAAGILVAIIAAVRAGYLAGRVARGGARRAARTRPGGPAVAARPEDQPRDERRRRDPAAGVGHQPRPDRGCGRRPERTSSWTSPVAGRSGPPRLTLRTST